MARLRANAGRSAATLLARLPGLTIMRRQEQRLEPAGPEPERWRGWMLQIMVHGARSVTAGPRILAQGPGALLWSGPCPGALQVRYLPGVVADCLTLAWSDEGWRQFLARFPHFAARHRRQLDAAMPASSCGPLPGSCQPGCAA